MRIRPFAESDWPAFEPVFAEVVAAGETYAIPEGEDPRGFWTGEHVVVAESDDGTLLGSAKTGPNRPAQGSHVGTASFMVGSHARGSGVGRALAVYVVDWHRRAGYRGIQFNAVVETNTAAVHLWRTVGFEIIGTVPGAFQRPSGEYVGLHVMYLDLTDSSA
ncbi:GNAT family N-acetyltransferase [Nocardioides mangrovicus]|uniref:GNAT family N-acetyltransferase n=1 Tax=Nocardioides mangrovicus TaxID=2478913 RepID=A0A3L8P6U6_9ACTN|nr:GNAT family N-acetyltransferase [Nocardioides mangrovicus]RLV50707.1 GNAT family N-acetyltransferase [Nocardioides mangrovicus]